MKVKKSPILLEDIFICAAYLPPCDSSSNQLYDPPWNELQQEIAQFEMLGSTILIGDFNARTANFQHHATITRKQM